MQNELIVLNTDKTFHRILAALLSFYVATVLFVQLKGESLQLNKPARIAPQEEPPRVARLLVEPQKPPRLPPPKVEPLQPPKIEPAKIEKPASPVAPTQGLPKGEPASAPSAVPKTPPQEQVKNVGLLGLLGGSKGSNSGSPVGRGFSSLKEIPPPSSEKQTSSSSSPLPSFAQEEIEKIRQRTLAQQETKLIQTRQAVVQEDLSQTKITQEGASGSRQNQEAVSGIVHQNRDKLQLIYNKQLRRKPELQGFLTVEFVISAEGQVVECRVVTSSLSDPIFEKEVVQEILRWRFPSTSQGITTVLYPLSFSPTG
jgi:TonB family protein